MLISQRLKPTTKIKVPQLLPEGLILRSDFQQFELVARELFDFYKRYPTGLTKPKMTFSSTGIGAVRPDWNRKDG